MQFVLWCTLWIDYFETMEPTIIPQLEALNISTVLYEDLKSVLNGLLGTDIDIYTGNIAKFPTHTISYVTSFHMLSFCSGAAFRPCCVFWLLSYLACAYGGQFLVSCGISLAMQ